MSTTTKPVKTTARPARSLAILALVLIALTGLVFVQGATAVRLGLDLRGGTSVTLQPRIAPGENGKVTNEAMVVETRTTYNNEVKQGEEVEINLTFFDHDKKRLHFKMEMIEKSSKKLSATLESLSLYIDLNRRKVSEFENEKIKIMDEFILKNNSIFKNDNLKFSSKLKK